MVLREMPPRSFRASWMEWSTRSCMGPSVKGRRTVCYSPFRAVMTVDRVAMTTLQVLQGKGKRSMWPFCPDTSRCFRGVVVESPKYSDQDFTRFQANQSFPEKHSLRWGARPLAGKETGRLLAGCPSVSLGVLRMTCG